MAREAPEVRLIRETLEGVLHPSAASALFFEALEQHPQGMPTSPPEALALVRGPIAALLDARVGEDAAASVVEQLNAMLGTLAGGAKGRKSTSRHDMPTAATPISDESVLVFVLSATRDFAARLKAALGPRLIVTVPVADEPTFVDRLGQISPAVVVIDASQFPAIEPAALVEHLARVPSHVVKAVWGTDLAYGQRVLDAALRRGVTLTPFDRTEGIAPLMDVIRSRTAQ